MCHQLLISSYTCFDVSELTGSAGISGVTGSRETKSCFTWFWLESPSPVTWGSGCFRKKKQIRQNSIHLNSSSWWLVLANSGRILFYVSQFVDITLSLCVQTNVIYSIRKQLVRHPLCHPVIAACVKGRKNNPHRLSLIKTLNDPCGWRAAGATALREEPHSEAGAAEGAECVGCCQMMCSNIKKVW